MVGVGVGGRHCDFPLIYNVFWFRHGSVYSSKAGDFILNLCMTYVTPYRNTPERPSDQRICSYFESY